jgi:hypothetical protein
MSRSSLWPMFALDADQDVPDLAAPFVGRITSSTN